MIKKLILFEHAVETLGYFSRQMAGTLERLNYKLFYVDLADLDKSTKKVRKFAKKENTAVLTFNFIGLSAEVEFQEPSGISLWEHYDLPCYCIMVDHPLYYYDQLNHYNQLNYDNQQNGDEEHHRLVAFCVDRGHVEYIQRFYPHIPCYFLPLAGNILQGDLLTRDMVPFHQRKYDVAFIANYVALPTLEEHFKERTQEYIDFYHEILKGLRDNPSESIDDLMERIIRQEIPEATDEEICQAQHGIAFLDLYNRSYYREKVIQTLLDAGIRVHVFGQDWEKMPCHHPEHLIVSGRMLTSAECVEVIRNSKIALNVMPWFKKGAHDRIFTAMLNGAIALTDDSIYLREIMPDTELVNYYDLTALADLPAQIKYILSDEQAAQAKLEQAYLYAKANHTWGERALVLHEYIRKTNKIQ